MKVVQYFSTHFLLMAWSDRLWATDGGLRVARDGHWASGVSLTFELLPLASNLSLCREWWVGEATEDNWFITELVVGSLSSSLESLIDVCKVLSTKTQSFWGLICLWSIPASISRLCSFRSRFSALLSLGERAGLILMAGGEATCNFLLFDRITTTSQDLFKWTIKGQFRSGEYLPSLKQSLIDWSVTESSIDDSTTPYV